jgi:ligand-binding sensor domain-containing protein/class 3 adenylate cyclase
MQAFQRIIFFFFVSICFAADAFVLYAQETLSFRHFSVEQGLSQNTAYVIMQDRDGFLWFGTGDGLNRFDGAAFTLYRAQNSDSSLSNSFITALQQDSFGTIWVGTRDGGLNALNLLTGRFTQFKADARNSQPRSSTAPSNLSPTLPSNRINALLMARDGRTLWICTDEGLCTLDVTAFAANAANPANVANVRFRRWSIPAQPAAPPSSAQTIQAITSICEDRTATGTFWIGTLRGLYSFTPQTNTWKTFSRSNSPLATDTVNAVLHDHTGAIWSATEDGLYCYRPSTGTSSTGAWRAYRHSSDLNSLPNNNLTTLYEDAQGRLWIGTTTGLAKYAPERDGFVSFKRNPLDSRSLSGIGVRSIFQDKSGVLWVATYGTGLNATHDNTSAFATYTIATSEEQGASNDGISALCEDRTGTLWAGTWTSGVTRFDAVGGGSTHKGNIRTGQSQSGLRATPVAKSVLNNDFIHCIVEDRAGLLWIGSEGGVDVIDPRTNRIVERHRHNPHNTNSLSSDRVFAVWEDRKGMMWIGTLNAGLNCYNPVTKQWRRFQHDANNPTSLSADVVRSIVADSTGTLWVATRGGGLNTFDPRTGTFKHFRHNDRDSTSISVDALFTLFVDSRNTLWIGTQGGGLCRFNAASETFTAFTTRDGLPNNVIYSVMEDRRGNLWCSTNKGIVRLNRAVLDAYTPTLTKQPAYKRLFERNPLARCYDVRDGLQSDEFNAGAFAHGRSGRMYMGGVRGFNVFVPDSARDNTFIPPVAVTAFRLFDQEQNERLRHENGQRPHIRLKHDDNFFTFDFAALNFLLPEKNRYAYKLEGFDADWIDAAAKREASYTNLEEGTYTFHVRASNNDGVWNMRGAAVELTIDPPWWRAWWFRVTAALSVGGALVLGYKARTRAMKLINKRLESEVEARTAELSERNAQLTGANEEIQRQIAMLDEQTRAIELANTTLQEKNLEIEFARQQSEELLLNVLPAPIASRLKAGEQTIADCFDGVTVMFADIVGFTGLATRKTAGELVELLNRVFSAFDIFSERYGLEKIKTIGDAYMIVGGIPVSRDDPRHYAEAAANMALEMLQTVELLGKTTNVPLSIRIGIHTGTVVAGVIGQKKFAYDLWGDTVNTASRMESHGEAGKIHVTEEVVALLEGRFVFESRGAVEVKGKGAMQTYFLTSRLNTMI